MKRIAHNKQKPILFVIILCVFFYSFQCSAAGDNDPRLALRSEDVFTPYSESIYFSRYTPWLKTMALVSKYEKENNIIGGDGDQQIRCIDISSVDTNLVVMGSDTSGVWITTDGGEFWYNTTANMDRTEIADVFCHPDNKSIIFVYSHSNKNGLSVPGIFRSENMGKSWECVFPDYISSSVVDELFACDNSGNLYAVTGKGVIKSTDDGKTWNTLLSSTDKNSEKNRGTPVSIDVTADGKIITACYSGTEASLKGINISTDSGATWSKISADFIKSVYSCDIVPNSEQRLIISAANNKSDSNNYRLYVTDISGKEWSSFKAHINDKTMLRPDKPVARVKFGGDYLYVAAHVVSDSFRRLPIAFIDSAESTEQWEVIDLMTPGQNTFLPADGNMYFSQGFDIEGNTLFACNTGSFKSTDGGETWVRKSSGFNGALMTDMKMDKEGNMIICLTDGNIAVSDGAYTDESTPAFERRGRWGSSLSTMVLPDPNDKDHLICWYGNSNRQKNDIGIIVSYDGGKTYKSSPDAKDESDIYDGENKLYKTRISDPLTINPCVLEYDAEYKDVIYTSCATSKNNGEEWEPNPYYLLDICDSDPDKRVAWDVYGTSPSYYIMYSADRGKTWSRLAQAGTKLGHETEAFFDSENSGKLWFKTQDDFGIIDISSKKMTSLSGKVSYRSFGTLIQNPKASNHMLLSCEELKGENCPSLYESLDYGNSWHVVPGIYGMRTIRYMFFSETTDEVFLGCHNGIIVYEYEKFNYYIGTKLSYAEETTYTTLEMKDGCVIAPKQAFFPYNTQFNGWRYGSKTYLPGESIRVEK